MQDASPNDRKFNGSRLPTHKRRKQTNNNKKKFESNKIVHFR